MACISSSDPRSEVYDPMVSRVAEVSSTLVPVAVATVGASNPGPVRSAITVPSAPAVAGRSRQVPRSSHTTG